MGARRGWYISAAVAVAVFSAWLIGGWGGAPVIAVVDDLGLVLFGAAATICSCVTACRVRGRQRRAWAAIAIGTGGWTFGAAVWSINELALHIAPFPSLADIGYLLFPVGVGSGLVLFALRDFGHGQARAVLDGVIAATSLFAIGYLTVLHTIYEASADHGFGLALALAYPVSDLVLVALALLVLARARPGRRLALGLLTLGVSAMAISDCGFAYLTAEQMYLSGSAMDIGWAAGLALIAVAARVGADAPAMPSGPDKPQRLTPWLPYAPLLAAAVLVAISFQTIPGLAPIGAMVLVVATALVARQYIVVTENRKLQATVADQAALDQLTGVGNRAGFFDRMQQALDTHQRTGTPIAVLSVDLDDFSMVNDNLGHAAGDALLAQAADRIRSCMHTGDEVARLGGDEFAVLMMAESAENPMSLAQCIIAGFDAPFVVDGHEFGVRASAGIARLARREPAVTAEELLQRAVSARDAGKTQTDAQIHVYESDADDAAAAVGPEDGAPAGAAAVQLLGQLRDAVDNQDLSTVYQPKFDLRTDQIVGVEALLRWEHPEHGLLRPDEFLPLVRRRDLMGSITEVVLEQALTDVASWRAAGARISTAVNLFAPSLADPELPEKIARGLAEHGLSPDALILEITEDILLEDMDGARAVVERLRALGIRVAIDDFGCGYSGLWYLRDLPVDELKLDKRYIAPLLVDHRSAVIVRAVVDLAHQLGVTTVAEGVENAEIAERLRSFGCDIGQGYYYSAPVTGDEMAGLLAATRTASASAISS